MSRKKEWREAFTPSTVQVPYVPDEDTPPVILRKKLVVVSSSSSTSTSISNHPLNYISLPLPCANSATTVIGRGENNNGESTSSTSTTSSNTAQTTAQAILDRRISLINKLAPSTPTNNRQLASRLVSPFTNQQQLQQPPPSVYDGIASSPTRMLPSARGNNVGTSPLPPPPPLNQRISGSGDLHSVNLRSQLIIIDPISSNFVASNGSPSKSCKKQLLKKPTDEGKFIKSQSFHSSQVSQTLAYKEAHQNYYASSHGDPLNRVKMHVNTESNCSESQEFPIAHESSQESPLRMQRGSLNNLFVGVGLGRNERHNLSFGTDISQNSQRFSKKVIHSLDLAWRIRNSQGPLQKSANEEDAKLISTTTLFNSHLHVLRPSSIHVEQSQLSGQPSLIGHQSSSYIIKENSGSAISSGHGSDSCGGVQKHCGPESIEKASNNTNATIINPPQIVVHFGISQAEKKQQQQNISQSSLVDVPNLSSNSNSNSNNNSNSKNNNKDNNCSGGNWNGRHSEGYISNCQSQSNLEQIVKVHHNGFKSESALSSRDPTSSSSLHSSQKPPPLALQHSSSSTTLSHRQRPGTRIINIQTVLPTSPALLTPTSNESVGQAMFGGRATPGPGASGELFSIASSLERRKKDVTSQQVEERPKRAKNEGILLKPVSEFLKASVKRSITGPVSDNLLESNEKNTGAQSSLTASHRLSLQTMGSSRTREITHIFSNLLVDVKATSNKVLQAENPSQNQKIGNNFSTGNRITPVSLQIPDMSGLYDPSVQVESPLKPPSRIPISTSIGFTAQVSVSPTSIIQRKSSIPCAISFQGLNGSNLNSMTRSQNFSASTAQVAQFASKLLSEKTRKVIKKLIVSQESEITPFFLSRGENTQLANLINQQPPSEQKEGQREKEQQTNDSDHPNPSPTVRFLQYSQGENCHTIDSEDEDLFNYTQAQKKKTQQAVQTIRSKNRLLSSHQIQI